MRRFVGKTVGITGAARGIGQAIATRFALEGADVAVMDVADLSETAEQCETAGRAVLALHLDLRSGDAIRLAVNDVYKRFSKIDIWVNNAGVFDNTATTALSEKEWDRISDINYKSMFLCIQAVIPYMLKGHGGRIINMSSMAGKMAYPKEIAYCSTKAAVLGLTRALAAEFGSRGITVNAICPGPIRTEMLKSTYQTLANEFHMSLQDWEAKVLETIPVGRFGDPAEVAALAAFLASEEAGFINGQAVNIDGGMVFY
jgi:NAD(P)-dependent dehydrogenase (short-subunit alcohol dehydrogenase family)